MSLEPSSTPSLKVRAICRSVPACTRETRQSKYAERRNPGNPVVHPFQQAREYVRAVNAVKVERMFAKPFVGAMEGHRDGIYALAVDPTSLRTVVSAGADGDIRVWDLPSRKTIAVAEDAHTAFIRGVAYRPLPSEHASFYSCSDDHTVKLWSQRQHAITLEATFEAGDVVLSVDHFRKQDAFLTAGGDGVLEWTSQRSQPLRKFLFTSATSTTQNAGFCAVRCNAAQADLFVCSGATDRSVILGDRRVQTLVSRQVLQMRTNALAWNPHRPDTFAVGNEDHRAYIFDIRHLQRPLQILQDHVGPVMAVDFAPTGLELLTGGYDRTVRLYDLSSHLLTLHSRDVYHGQRMQRVFAATWTADSAYVVSGSDDGVARVWKAQSATPIGPVRGREQTSLQYRAKLVDKFGHLPEVRRIHRHRHLPKEIKGRQRTERIQQASIAAKAENRIQHSRSKEKLPNVRDDAVLRVD